MYIYTGFVLHPMDFVTSWSLIYIKNINDEAALLRPE